MYLMLLQIQAHSRIGNSPSLKLEKDIKHSINFFINSLLIVSNLAAGSEYIGDVNL